MKNRTDGWIVIVDNKDRIKTIPVAGKFFLTDDDAYELFDNMNHKREQDPATYRFPYKIVKATLIIGK